MDRPFNLAVVVDDDPDIALAARLALRDMFAEVETLSSPAELLALLKKKNPDAILLDLNFERGGDRRPRRAELPRPDHGARIRTPRW